MSIASNTFVIYEHDDRTSKSKNFKLSDYRAKEVHSISGSSLNDKATLVVYNLPVGTVVTLMEHAANNTPPQLGSAGKTYDLIGTGAEVALKLNNVSMNDALTAFFWRTVDVSKGQVWLYEHSDYTGVRQVIFLSEWAAGQTHNLKDWFSTDRASSIKWVKLPYNVYVDLFEHSDGKGKKNANITGGSGSANLKDGGFNDIVSSFRIDYLEPKKEMISQVVIDNIVMSDQSETSLKADGSVNAGDYASVIECRYTSTVVETTTVTLVDSYNVSSTLGYTYAWEQPTGTNWKLTLSCTYTQSSSKTTTQTQEKTVSLQVGETHTCPPKSSWKFVWLAKSGKADLTYTTTVKRWYEEQLPGSVASEGMWLIESPVSGTFKGSMHIETVSSFNTTPL